MVVVLRVHVSLVIVPVTSLAYPAQAFVNVKMVLVASIHFVIFFEKNILFVVIALFC